MKKKQIIKLTEGDLHRIVKESVNKVLEEDSLSNVDPNEIGMATQRRRNEIANVLGPELMNLFKEASNALDVFLTQQGDDWDYDEELTDEQYEALNTIGRFFFKLSNP